MSPGTKVFDGLFCKNESDDEYDDNDSCGG